MRDVIRKRGYAVRFPLIHPIGNRHTFLSGNCIYKHFRIHISLVVQRFLDLRTRHLRKHRIIDHRRHSRPAQPAVHPFRRIAARQIVDTQLEAEHPKHPAVGCLPDIRLQLRSLYLFGPVFEPHFDFVQQIVALRHIAGGTTRCQQTGSYNQYPYI